MDIRVKPARVPLSFILAPAEVAGYNGAQTHTAGGATVEIPWALIAADIAAVLAVAAAAGKFLMSQARRLNLLEFRVEQLLAEQAEHANLLDVHLKESAEIRERLARLESKMDLLLKAQGL